MVRVAVGMVGLIAPLAIGTTSAEASTALAVCTLGGSMTFSPPITLTSVPAAVAVNISASGTCVSSISQATAVSFNANGSMLLTCEGGEGGLQSTFNFNSSLPPLASPAASAIAGPLDMSLVLTSSNVIGDAELAWTSPLALLACAPGGGVAAVPVAGTFTALYT